MFVIDMSLFLVYDNHVSIRYKLVKYFYRIRIVHKEPDILALVFIYYVLSI